MFLQNCSMRDAVGRAMKAFPKLSFYVPGLPRDEHHGLVVTEDMCAVLWLTEVACDKTGTALQSAVRRAARLSPDRFSRVLAILRKDGCIESDIDEENQSHRRLRLLRRGDA